MKKRYDGAPTGIRTRLRNVAGFDLSQTSVETEDL